MAGCQPGNTTGKCGRCWRWKYIKYMLKCRNPARDDYDDYEMIMMGRRSNKKNQSQQACTSAMIRRLCKPSAWASWPACREHVKSIHYHHIYHHSSPICQQDWKCIAISSLAAWPLGADWKGGFHLPLHLLQLSELIIWPPLINKIPESAYRRPWTSKLNQT